MCPLAGEVQIIDVLFLVIIDACRSAPDGIEPMDAFPATCEPKKRPNKWVLCVATSRGKPAYGSSVDSLDLSAFTHHVVSEECGLFERNVPVRVALQLVGDRLRDSTIQHGSSLQQDPTIIGIDRIDPNFCLLPFDEIAYKEFDVCLCYRLDVDEHIAIRVKCELEQKCETTLKIFLDPLPEGGETDRKIVQALCHSRMIVFIVSKHTFEGITLMQASSSCESPLAVFLWKCEMALEIHEHMADSGTKLLVLRSDSNVTWPTERTPKYVVKSIAEKARLGLRCCKKLASKLHNLLLKTFFFVKIPSLIKGRKLSDTICAYSKLQSFTIDVRAIYVSDILEIVQTSGAETRAGNGALAGESSSNSGSNLADEYNDLRVYVNTNGFPEKFALFGHFQSLAGAIRLAALGIANFFSSNGHQNNVPLVADAPTSSSKVPSNGTVGVTHSPSSNAITKCFSDTDTVCANINHAIVVVAVKNMGNSEDVVSHLDFFTRELMGGAKGTGQWRMSFCMILWIVFLEDALYDDPDVKNLEHCWLKKHCTEKKIAEEDMAEEIHLRVDQKVVTHCHPKLLQQVKDKMKDFQAKPCVASIAIIDHTVQDLLGNNLSGLMVWQEDVVKSWYDSPDDTVSDFLMRANDFLRDSIDGAALLLASFKIQSYVAFMRMPRLAACLLFGYLETCRFKVESSSSVGAAGGQDGRETLSHGFCTF